MSRYEFCQAEKNPPAWKKSIPIFKDLENDFMEAIAAFFEKPKPVFTRQ